MRFSTISLLLLFRKQYQNYVKLIFSSYIFSGESNIATISLISLRTFLVYYLTFYFKMKVKTPTSFHI